MSGRVYWANATLAFGLELAALAALGYWGFTADATGMAKIVLGVGAPLLAALGWGLYAAPRARFTLPTPAVVAVKLAVFGAAAAALYATGAHALGIVLAVAAVANTAAGLALPAPAGQGSSSTGSPTATQPGRTVEP